MDLRWTMRIAAPPSRVFALLVEPEQVRSWRLGLEEMTYLARPPAGESQVGARFRQRLVEGKRVAEYDGEITTYEKPGHVAMRIGNEHFSVDTDYRLESEQGGTLLRYSAGVVHHTRKSSFLDAIFRPLTARLLKKQMEALKAAAEGKGPRKGPR